VVPIGDPCPSVNVHVASVSAYLPSAEVTYVSPSEADNSLLTWKQVQIEAQKKDAEERVIVWDAEKIGRSDSPDADVQFEDHFSGSNSGTRHDEWIRIGIRSKEGMIVPFPVQPPVPKCAESIVDADTGDVVTQELLFTGRAECVPDCVQRLVSLVRLANFPFHKSCLLERREYPRTGWKSSADSGSRYEQHLSRSDH